MTQIKSADPLQTFLRHNMTGQFVILISAKLRNKNVIFSKRQFDNVSG